MGALGFSKSSANEGLGARANTGLEVAEGALPVPVEGHSPSTAGKDLLIDFFV